MPDKTDEPYSSDFARMVARLCSDPDFIAAKRALPAGNFQVATAALSALRQREPENVVVLAVEGQTALARMDFGKAGEIFDRCLEMYPAFPAALIGRVASHLGGGTPAQALRCIERMIELDPLNFDARVLMGAALNRLVRPAEAIQFLLSAANERLDSFSVHLELGNAYRHLGQTDKAIEAYRNAARQNYPPGEAWFALSDLKNYTIQDAELTEMKRLINQPAAPPGERIYLHYALGRAFYDRGNNPQSFQHYSAANMTLREGADKAIAKQTQVLNRSVDDTIAFLKNASPGGYRPEAGPVPIFIVGLPRSGTTLVEHMLASHSAIEGVGELAYIAPLADIERPGKPKWSERERLALGKTYIEQASVHRTSDAPYFVDKLPMNYHHVAFIKAILPQAKIIDVRRHPLASIFSMFRQNFGPTMPDYAGSLAQLAELRRHYVAVMDRFDAAFPAMVHRVHYEALVDNTDAEVRGMLDYIGVPFEPDCLRWYENQKASRTPSIEQVRQPIFRTGLDEWKCFEAYMGEAKKILADEIRSYRPGAPAFR